MDREQLRRIISEELARTLGTQGRAAPSSSSPPIVPGPRNLALVCFTGDRRPCDSLGPLFRATRRAGWTLEALPSYTFGEVVLKRDSRACGDLPVADDPDNEGAVAGLLEQVRAVIFPDISTNSLNKAALGMADSVPTRAIARMLSSARGCIFLETREPASPVVGLPRLEMLRRLERRGARIAGPDDFLDELNAAALRPVPRPFQSLAGQPVGRSPVSRAVLTAEDVTKAAGRGLSRLILPANTLVTDRAGEEARRLGVELTFEEAAS